jgi:hypothetical protein
MELRGVLVHFLDGFLLLLVVGISALSRAAKGGRFEGLQRLRGNLERGATQLLSGHPWLKG